MNAYNKEEIDSILNSNLLIHWWNFNKKTLDFNGTVKEYLNRENIEYTLETNLDNGFEVLKFKVKFNVGSLKDVKFISGNFEDVVRMCVNIRLTYMGDRSRFVFRGRIKNLTY